MPFGSPLKQQFGTHGYVNGVAMLAKFGQNLLYKPAIPKNFCTSFLSLRIEKSLMPWILTSLGAIKALPITWQKCRARLAKLGLVWFTVSSRAFWITPPGTVYVFPKCLRELRCKHALLTPRWRGYHVLEGCWCIF